MYLCLIIQAKIDVMLTKWGFAEDMKLRVIQKKLANK